MVDFSDPDTQQIFEREVRKRMEPPFLMSRSQAEMLVAVLMSEHFGKTMKAKGRAADASI